MLPASQRYLPAYKIDASQHTSSSSLTVYFAFFNPPAQAHPIFIRRLGPWSCCNFYIFSVLIFLTNLDLNHHEEHTSNLSSLLVAYVFAHGFVWKLGINSQTYTGNLPGATPTPSVIREITTQDPVKSLSVSNPSLTCGQNSIAGSFVADVNPVYAIKPLTGGVPVSVL